MMAQWDLHSLTGSFQRVEQPTLLIAGAGDRTVPPAQSVQVARLMPHGRYVMVPGLGHLAHEEDPAGTATLIEGFARETGVL
jgi:magnesium chelatase accessory protein